MPGDRSQRCIKQNYKSISKSISNIPVDNRSVKVLSVTIISMKLVPFHTNSVMFTVK